MLSRTMDTLYCDCVYVKYQCKIVNNKFGSTAKKKASEEHLITSVYVEKAEDHGTMCWMEQARIATLCFAC